MTHEQHMKIRERQMSATQRSRNPSKIVSCYWLFAKGPGQWKKSANSGKWLIFVHIDEVDVVWRKIKDAVEDGKLGSLAKVATAKPNPNAYDPNTKVICVYCEDSDDEAEVMRVREELRLLGVEDRIPYKTDQATRERQYKNKGSTRISKYFV